MLIAISIIILIILLYIVTGTVILCIAADKLDYIDVNESNILIGVSIWPILIVYFVYKTLVYSIAKLYEDIT